MLRSLFLFPLIAACSSGQNLPPTSERQLARDIYKELVEIKTGYTTGATTPAAEAMAARLRTGGFPESDIFVGGPIPTKANLVARYRGNGRRKPILLLAHLDVVEAKRKTGAWIRSNSRSGTVISTAAAPGTIKPKRPFGWRT